jgi:uncharacterized protein (TIGR02118 family)
MIKVVFCLRRKQGLTPEAFHRYWRQTHAPLVEAAAPLMGACRYVQVRTVDSPANEVLRKPRGGPNPFDGIAEMWWEDETAFNNSLATPEARRASAGLIADEANFIDLASSPAWIAIEDDVIPYARSASAT